MQNFGGCISYKIATEKRTGMVLLNWFLGRLIVRIERRWNWLRIMSFGEF
jgi:hypothetical protein